MATSRLGTRTIHLSVRPGQIGNIQRRCFVLNRQVRETQQRLHTREERTLFAIVICCNEESMSNRSMVY